MKHFIDLGAGWFLYDNDDDWERLSIVCDTTAPHPTHHFGPTAWGGGDGPVSGLIILEAEPVIQGHWDQFSLDEWKWYSHDGQVFDTPPARWPRRIVVKDSASGALLKSLEGRVVSSEAELAELMRDITAGQQQRVLPIASASGRLEAAKLMYPHIFGE